MKHFTSHNLLLEAAPTVFSRSSSREHICSSHETVTQPLSLPAEKGIHIHQHSCSCNLVPFLEPLAALSASSSLCESSPALHALPGGSATQVCIQHGMGIHASWTPNTYTCLHHAAQPSSGALNCRELLPWSWSDTLGLQPLQEKGSGTDDNGYQHYLLCSGGFKLQPVFYSGAH